MSVISSRQILHSHTNIYTHRTSIVFFVFSCDSELDGVEFNVKFILGAFNVKFILGARSLKQGNNEYIGNNECTFIFTTVAPEPCNWRAVLPLWRRWSTTKNQHSSSIISYFINYHVDLSWNAFTIYLFLSVLKWSHVGVFGR